MRDIEVKFRINGARVTMHALYLPDNHQFLLYVHTPIENTLRYKHSGLPVPVYDTWIPEAEHVHHEDWSIDAGAFWDWVTDTEQHLTLGGYGDNVYTHANDEYDFYESKDSVVAMLQWCTIWLEDNFAVAKN